MADPSAKHQTKPQTPERLTPTEFHILLALADTPRHGYGITREVAERSDGRVRLGPGTLYGAIKRLTAGGLIEEAPERPVGEPDDPRRRRYYRLTPNGREVAAEEARHLERVLETARAKRLVSNPNPVPAVEGGTT